MEICLLLVEVVHDHLDVSEFNILKAVLALPGIVYPLVDGSAVLLAIFQLLLMLLQIPQSERGKCGRRKDEGMFLNLLTRSQTKIKCDGVLTWYRFGFGCGASGQTADPPVLRIWISPRRTCGRTPRFDRSIEPLWLAPTPSRSASLFCAPARSSFALK